MKTVANINDLFGSNQIKPINKRVMVYRYLVQLKTHVLDFAKFLYAVLVLALLLVAVIELKHMFNVDIFPGVDTPFDNVYFAGKDQLGKGTIMLLFISLKYVML